MDPVKILQKIVSTSVEIYFFRSIYEHQTSNNEIISFGTVIRTFVVKRVALQHHIITVSSLLIMLHYTLVNNVIGLIRT